MSERVRLERLFAPALAGLAGVTRPSGERILQGLAHDLVIVPTFEQGWERVCEAAWVLGLSSLQLEPSAEFAAAIPARAAERHVAQPRRAYRVPCVMAELCVGRDVAATLTGYAGPGMRRFDREAFAVAVEGLLAQFAGGH